MTAAAVTAVADTGNHTIRKITPDGQVSTPAGKAGEFGRADGAGPDARFNSPTGLDVDASGRVLIADHSNHTIRAISPGGRVSTIAGMAGVQGDANGRGPEARFARPFDVVAMPGGDIYVADYLNRMIRRITPDGDVTLFAGTWDPGSSDGRPGSFDAPTGTTRDAASALHVTEAFNHTLRKILPSGEVTTLAGLAPEHGQVDGPGSTARFFYPRQIALGGERTCTWPTWAIEPCASSHRPASRPVSRRTWVVRGTWRPTRQASCTSRTPVIT